MESMPFGHRFGSVIAAFAFALMTTVCTPLALADTPTKPDAAWAKLQEAEQAFNEMKPAGMSQAEFDAFIVKYSKHAGELADQFRDYLAAHPSAANAPEAWDKWMEFLNVSAYKIPERRAELEREEKRQLDDPKLERERRERIRNNQIDRTTDPIKREKLIREVSTEFTSPNQFLCTQLLILASGAEHAHAGKLVEEVLKISEGKPTYGYWHEEARKLGAMLSRVGKPVDLKFTALDGRSIDLKGYHGKVVLIDFWATWCPPCIAGLPKVDAMSKSLREQGFEVIGVTYDTEQETLERFLKKTPLAWPQFFDPAGNESALAKSLGTPGPPAYWLIDRNGILVDLNARADLEAKVKKLLATPAK